MGSDGIGIVGGCRDSCFGWLLVGVEVGGFGLAPLAPWLNYSISVGLGVMLDSSWVR